jgi:hypothetical protein
MTVRIFTFDTTHHALWAEEVAKENRLAIEIVPAPAEANARCDIAIAALPEETARLAGVLSAAGIEFGMFSPAA